MGSAEVYVADTLALIEILSDPANRAPLEAERALAEGWYRRSHGGNEAESSERPSIPDTPQPPFVHAPCDVQLQPLSTVFRGDCTEYGLVVLDISDLDSGVKYGIVGFPVRYMAEVSYHSEEGGWDPVEDPPPKKEPDIVPISPRPRVPLSIIRWLRKYCYWMRLKEDPSVLRLEDRPLVDAAALDYIWPPELENQARVENQGKASSQGVTSSISDCLLLAFKVPTRAKSASTSSPWRLTTSDEPPRDAHMDRAKDASSTTASRLTTSHEPPRNAHIDRAIDNLLILTQEPADLHLDKKTMGKFQKLAEFREQLRRRLEEV
ncbi:hypothetical protein VN97_g13187, partial [Penicillium thymicola]